MSSQIFRFAIVGEELVFSYFFSSCTFEETTNKKKGIPQAAYGLKDTLLSSNYSTSEIPNVIVPLYGIPGSRLMPAPWLTGFAVYVTVPASVKEASSVPVAVSLPVVSITLPSGAMS